MPQPPAWPPRRLRRARLRRAGPERGSLAWSRPAAEAGGCRAAGGGPCCGDLSAPRGAGGGGRWPLAPGAGAGRGVVPGGAGRGRPPVRRSLPGGAVDASLRSAPGCHGPGVAPLRPPAGGPPGTGAGRGREAGHLARLARASSSCWGEGLDTSLTRIAAFSVTFIPGIIASTA